MAETDKSAVSPEVPSSEADSEPDGGASGMTEVEARKWLSRIDARRRAFQRGWWKCGKEALEMYNLEKGYDLSEKRNPFNILYSNTEVLLPALYSNLPRPDVRSRFGDLQDNVAQAAENLLTASLDDNVPGTADFDNAMELATLGSLVPGMGFARVRYYPDAVCPLQYETGGYDELVWGYASSWPRVPWISFEHSMTKDQICDEFELTPEEALRVSVPTQDDKDSEGAISGNADSTPCLVHEVWIKSSKKIVFLCDAFDGLILREIDDDPMKIAGFFPTPGPLVLIKKAKTLDPTPPYEYYKVQAKELNRVTARIDAVLSAIKVRGVYNAIIGPDLDAILSDESMENKLTPSKVPMDMQKGFDGNIWLLPIEQLIIVARELYGQRQQVLQVIYQITGISDIIRGSTAASETASAQQIKDKWSGVRLRRNQKRVGAYARDLLRITVDIAAEQLPEAKWKAITQLPFPTSQEKKQAQQVLQAIQMRQMVNPGMPPQQPPQQLLDAANQQSWGEILSVLKSDQARSYSIDIETFSTIDPDAQIDKQEVGEFMTAMGQFIAGAAPLAQLQGGGDVVKQLLLAIAGKYKFGRSVTAALKKLGGPIPQPPQGEAAQPDFSLQVAQVRAQTDLQRTQMQTASSEKIAALESKVEILVEQMKAGSKTQTEAQKLAGQQQLASQNHGQEMMRTAVQADQAASKEFALANQQHQNSLQQGQQQAAFSAKADETRGKQALALQKARPKPGANGRKG